MKRVNVNQSRHAIRNMQNPALSKKKKAVPGILFTCTMISLSLLVWNCSKTIQPGTTGSQSLKQSLSASAQNLNTAVTEISQSRGYQILSLNGGNQVTQTANITTQFQDSITLRSIAGVYEYNPTTIDTSCYDCMHKLFQKTGTSSDLIVKLPEEKVFHPLHLRLHFLSDTSLTNNFTIDASDFHYYYSMGNYYDYRLMANFAVNDTSIGSLDLMSTRDANTGYLYNSSFSFPNGYNFSVNVKSGDTTASTIMLSNATDTLLAETVSRIRTTGSFFHERQYILMVGNVKIVRSSNDSTQIYLNNVLQKNATIAITDSTGTPGSICGSRDVKITFDDGTSTTISSLLGPSLTVMKGLVSSMENIYFATNIVDYIAWDIHQNNTP